MPKPPYVDPLAFKRFGRPPLHETIWAVMRDGKEVGWVGGTQDPKEAMRLARMKHGKNVDIIPTWRLPRPHLLPNPDVDLRGLWRRAQESGDPHDAERLFRAATRAGAYDQAAQALLMLGSLHANEIMLTLPLGGERDLVAIELGKILIADGWQPNLPVSSSMQFATRSWNMGPKWFHGDFGRARRRRIHAYVSFSGPGLGHVGWPPDEAEQIQAPTLRYGWNRHFAERPQSYPYKVQEHLGKFGHQKVFCKIGPKVCYLTRWNDAALAGRNTGFGFHYPSNQAYAYTRSHPDWVPGSYDRTTADDNWQSFLRSARIGVIPGEQAPPRGELSSAEITAWLDRPERREALRAIFYADLWLASAWLEANAEYFQHGVYGSREHPLERDERFMVPPGEHYLDLRERPTFYRNPDEGRRRRARGAGADPRAQAQVIRDRMRAGDLGRGDLLLLASMGYAPAALAIDYRIKEPPLADADDLMLTLAPNNETAHRRALLVSHALLMGTYWIWEEILNNGPGTPFFSQDVIAAPQGALRWLSQLADRPGEDCPSDEERSQAFLNGVEEAQFFTDEASFDASSLGPGESAPISYRLAESAREWLRGLHGAVAVGGMDAHAHWQASLWGTSRAVSVLPHVHGGRPRAGVPLYAYMVQQIYRHTVWAVAIYRGASSNPTVEGPGIDSWNPLLESAQQDVDRWALEIILPELLG
jgi:hypothetical protein